MEKDPEKINTTQQIPMSLGYLQKLSQPLCHVTQINTALMKTTKVATICSVVVQACLTLGDIHHTV